MTAQPVETQARTLSHSKSMLQVQHRIDNHSQFNSLLHLQHQFDNAPARSARLQDCFEMPKELNLAHAVELPPAAKNLMTALDDEEAGIVKQQRATARPKPQPFQLFAK